MKKLTKYFVSFVVALFLLGSVAQSVTVGAQESGDPVKIALLIGNRGDMSFNDSAVGGMEQAAADFEGQIEVNVIEYGADPSNFEPNFLDAAEAGYDVVISGSNFAEYITMYAQDYPEVSFWMFDNEFDFSAGGYDNVYSIVYKANEASYLGGYISASTSDTGVLGFLGGIDQTIISDFLVGFVQGAQEANPDIKVVTSYVGSWTDSAKGKELGFAMFNQNASIVFNVAGGSGVGLIEAAVETGKQVLGVDSDQAMIYKEQGQEEFAKVIPTSVLKNVGDSLYRAIDLFLKDELPLGTNETLGIAEGGVGLADNDYYRAAYSEELIAEVTEIQEKILAGEITVDSAYGMTTEEITEIRESVRP